MSRGFGSPKDTQIQNNVIEDSTVYKKGIMVWQSCIYYRNERLGNIKISYNANKEKPYDHLNRNSTSNLDKNFLQIQNVSKHP